MNYSSSNGNLRTYTQNHYYHLECLFFQKVAFIITTQKQEKVSLLFATLLRQNNIAKYSKDCLCVLESPYFCLVRYLGVSYNKKMNDTANFARVIW